MNRNSISTFERFIERWSSTKIFFWLSISLFILFYAASAMCKKKIENGGFMNLNNILLIEWLTNSGKEHPIIATWLIIIFFCFFILALNVFSRIIIEFNQLILITKNTFFSGSSRSHALFYRKISIFLVHFSFILIISFYGIASVTGIKFTGPSLEKGKIIQHSLLPAQIECIDIQESTKTNIEDVNIYKVIPKYTAVLKVNNIEFIVPGWHDGIYYDIKMSKPTPISDAGKKNIQKTELRPKLFIHSFHVGYFITVLSFWFLSFLLYTLMRPGLKILFKNKDIFISEDTTHENFAK